MEWREIDRVIFRALEESEQERLRVARWSDRYILAAIEEEDCAKCLLIHCHASLDQRDFLQKQELWERVEELAEYYTRTKWLYQDRMRQLRGESEALPSEWYGSGIFPLNPKEDEDEEED